MRFFKNFQEAVNEIQRDLAELSVEVQLQTYQDKFIGNDPNFLTKEIQNYAYTVTQPKPEDLNPTQPWADAEFKERISGEYLNPGEAWKLRPEVWEQFLEPNGRFGYSYPERLSYDAYNHDGGQIQRVIDHVKKDPGSRQLYISVWDPTDLAVIGGIHRVPCTLGYQVMVRNGAVNLTYMQRSADFATHFQNDLYLAHRLQRYIAEQTGYEVGMYTHFIGSLHVYAKDVKHVF